MTKIDHISNGNNYIFICELNEAKEADENVQQKTPNYYQISASPYKIYNYTCVLLKWLKYEEKIC